MKFIFATNNRHKIEEIRGVLPQDFSILTLDEAGINIDIPEPYETLQENAREKAQTIYQLTHINCFGEDTGLEVAALNGEPGVHSARYAGEDRSFQKNIEKLLYNLQGADDKSAQFRTVICLLINNEEYFFEGICRGRIIAESKGTQGFGYDPVFIPEGADKTFAEMSLTEKSQYSHRSRAVSQLVLFLNNFNQPKKEI